MAQSTALITGIHGFCGRILASQLAEQGCLVRGIDRMAGSLDPAGVVYNGDLRDGGFLRSVVEEVRPAYVYHLAALTDPAADLDDLLAVNVGGTRQLLDTIRQVGLDPVVLVAGSSAAYGLVETSDLPIRESQPLRPTSAYAVAKIAQEMLAHVYYARYRLRVIRTRTFNLTGPGESAAFVTSAIARQIAAIEAGRQELIVRLGNTRSVRDFTDARDAMRAYRLLAERGEPGGLYNVCSGEGTAVHQVLDRLLALSRVAGIAVAGLDSLPHPSPADVPIQVGDPARLRAATGWRRAIPFGQTLLDVLDDWRRRIDPAQVTGTSQVPVT